MTGFGGRLADRWRFRAGVALIACAVPLAAAAKEKEVFAAGARIAETLEPSNDPDCQPSDGDSVALGLIEGTGLATTIGSFSVTSVDCIRSQTPDFMPPYAFSSASLTLTAANGDQIVATYSGSAVPQPSGLFLLTGDYRILRGTGKFHRVKGSGTLVGVENLAPVQVGEPARGFVAFTGQIQY